MNISETPQATQTQEYLIGSIGVSGKTKWDVLDGVIRRLFKVIRREHSKVLVKHAIVLFQIKPVFISMAQKSQSTYVQAVQI